MKIIDVATRRRVTIAMFTVAVALFGSVSLSRLNLNLLPDLSYPTLTIRSEYEGAAPVEIENLLTKPVEEALGVVKNVKEMRSVSRTGQSDVVLEFEWGTDMDMASIDVRERLDALLLPLEATRPVLLRFDPSFDPVMRYALYMEADVRRADAGENPVQTVALEDASEDTEDLKVLRRFADEQLKKELEAALGVAAVKISGGLEDEVQILVDQEKLAQLGIPIERIVQVIRAENVNLSGGRLEEGVQQFLVRTVNQFQTVSQIGDVIVETRQARPIYLRDVADVRMGYKEREAITRINGREAVELAVYKEGDANTVSVADAVKSRLDRTQNLFPEGVRIENVYDQSTFIRSAVDDVVNAGIVGGLLAVLVLYLFLRNLAATLIISVSIPVSVIATFNMMYGYDLTLNIMSLGGLALGIGLLVDNSIVVLENISRHRERGEPPLEAARKGASEVGRAVIASTLTTVAVFFPLVFVQGIAGQLFRDQALTVTFSLLASLIVAITLIPMLASLGGRAEKVFEVPERPPARTRFGRGVRKVRHVLVNRIPFYIARGAFLAGKGIGKASGFVMKPIAGGFNRGFDMIAARYKPALVWSLDHRAGVLLVAIGIFAGSIALIPSLGIELIPQLAQDEFNVEMQLAPGTPLTETDAAMARVQRVAAAAPNVRASFSVSGSGNRMDSNPEEGGENWGELHVALATGSGELGEAEAVNTIRGELGRIPGLQYKIARPTLFSFRTPVELEVTGYDLDDLKLVSQALAGRLRQSDRFTDVKSTMEVGHPEVQIRFDRERAAALGLSVSNVADRLVSNVRGSVATRYSWNDRKIDVLVRTREEDRASVDQLRDLIVNPESERPVTLNAIADLEVGLGPSEIRRVSQQRVALVTANLSYGDLGAAAEELSAAMASVRTPPGTSVRIAGQNQEMSDSFRSLILALLLAVFLVYLVMASQFESLLHPFVIFFSIPLAAVGAILALWVTGSTVSVVVFIGLILLAGIVVNNAIVLVDLINQLRTGGMEKVEAIIEAGSQRLRPILMTTLTTTLGLVPLAIGFGEGAEIRAPMAITVIGGLVVSTALTLLVIPTMYAVLDRTR
ncbi:MAG: efflux RND transporter permease subunit [Rhodothermales bacterium]|nr:efflux RND transporter permease subunit [Rhodothermales bacterium]MBO6780566.1 efflux RND transporter permease subunit [Rhodothermales bacterium]